MFSGFCIVAGVPRMCIMMYVQPRRAMVGNISGSRRPAEMSFMMCAPAFIAASATEARYVSMLIGMCLASGRDFMMEIAGSMRAISSSAVTSGAFGREDWPPMSIMVAPAAIWDAMVLLNASRSVGSLAPPSENESGVTFSMDMTCVLLAGSNDRSSSLWGARGVIGNIERSPVSSSSRCLKTVFPVTGCRTPRDMLYGGQY